MRSTTRHGNLDRIFKNGNSELMNIVARLSVLYEDFRVDYTSLFQIAENPRSEDPNERYRMMYLIRRSIATMSEFQGGLTQLLRSTEYKEIKSSIADHNRESIETANRNLQSQCMRVKSWRDAIGGHFQSQVASEACKLIPKGTVGSITWSRQDKAGFYLHLQYAEFIVTAAIIGRLEGVDANIELHEALEGVLGCYPELSRAAFAIVHEFVWNKFGR